MKDETDSDDLDLNKLFQGELGSESDILKELFSSEDVDVKTELSRDEISIIARLKIQADIQKSQLLHNVLENLETLRISLDRKSRKEFSDSFRALDDTNKQAGVLGNIGKIFNKDKT